MKKFTSVLVVVLCFTLSTDVYGVGKVTKAPENLPENIVLDESFPATSVEDFLSLTPKEIKKRTGQQLKLKEVVLLKAAQKKIKKQLKKESKEQDGPKSQIVALLLGILVGALGIHRFYLGYTGIGIAQLLTLGGCGVWALIDIIRIAMGTLLPADGSDYDPTL